MDIDGKAPAMMFRPMPVLSVLSVVSLAILILLGNWQYERYQGKRSAPAVEQSIEKAVDLSLRVETDHPGAIQHVYGFADGEPLWRRYVPATVEGSGERILAFVEATGGPEPVSAAIATMPSELRYRGTLMERDSKKGFMGNADEPEANQWYRLNAEAIAANLGIEGSLRVAEPLMMTVRNSADLEQSRTTANPYVFAKPVDPLPPERHLGYALTWWGMALGLLGVYGALHHAQGRLRFRKV